MPPPIESASAPNDDTAPKAPSKPSSSHRIFFGRDGLRAGWSLLLFTLIFAALLSAAIAVTRALHHASARHSSDSSVSLSTTLVNDFVPFAILLLVTWIMSKIERRPFSVYGLGGPRRLPRFFAGLAWGVFFLSLLVFTLWKAGLLVIDHRSLFGLDIIRFSGAWLAAFFLIGLFEEFLFRGYLQFTLARGLAGLYRSAFKTSHSAVLGFWTAALIWAFLFGFVHKGNPGESPIGLLCASLASLMFSYTLWRTGSLWWAIGLHTAWDYSQSFVYGVADSGIMMRQHLLTTHPTGRLLLSGGATGPEGSLFVLPMMALIVVVITFTLPRRSTNYLPGDPTIENA